MDPGTKHFEYMNEFVLSCGKKWVSQEYSELDFQKYSGRPLFKSHWPVDAYVRIRCSKRNSIITYTLNCFCHIKTVVYSDYN